MPERRQLHDYDRLRFVRVWFIATLMARPCHLLVSFCNVTRWRGFSQGGTCVALVDLTGLTVSRLLTNEVSEGVCGRTGIGRYPGGYFCGIQRSGGGRLL